VYKGLWLDYNLYQVLKRLKGNFKMLKGIMINSKNKPLVAVSSMAKLDHDKIDKMIRYNNLISLVAMHTRIDGEKILKLI
jgi:hypothetical protein